MPRTFAITCIVIVAVAGLVAPPRGWTAPAPEKPTLNVKPAGSLTVSDFYLTDGAILDRTKIVLVGTKYCDIESDDPNKYDPDRLAPNGAIIDLDKKTTQAFVNGHKAGLFSISVGRGRIVTTSNERDPMLRIWDIKAAKNLTPIEIETPEDGKTRYGAACLHRSDRVAVSTRKEIHVFDVSKPENRTKFSSPNESTGFLHRPVIDLDDRRIACEAVRCDLVTWTLEDSKFSQISLLPKKVENPEQWHTWGVFFDLKGNLYALRSGGADEVPEKTAEVDASVDLRNFVRIGLPDGIVTPLGMGQASSTLSCAFDHTGSWLATVGWGRVDKPGPDGIREISELRVYHLATKTLVFREQFKSGYVAKWVSFMPSGKRIVVATAGGDVRWWDVQAK